MRGNARMTPALATPFDPLAQPQRLVEALLPLDAEPQGPAWNQDELADLVDVSALAPAAVLVGLVPREHGTSVLLTRRNDNMTKHAGQVSFPGGRIDAGDASAIDAALREAFEEIALEASKIEPLGFLDPYTTITGYRVLPVVARVSPDYRAEPNPREVAEAFEAPLAPLLRGERIQCVEAMYKDRVRSIWEYGVGPHRIWGATAAMLVNFARRLGLQI